MHVCSAWRVKWEPCCKEDMSFLWLIPDSHKGVHVCWYWYLRRAPTGATHQVYTNIITIILRQWWWPSVSCRYRWIEYLALHVTILNGNNIHIKTAPSKHRMLDREEFHSLVSMNALPLPLAILNSETPGMGNDAVLHSPRHWEVFTFYM